MVYQGGFDQLWRPTLNKFAPKKKGLSLFAQRRPFMLQFSNDP
jgi:hypothetical protein